MTSNRPATRDAPRATPDRYRRATFALAQAAKEVQAATAELAGTKLRVCAAAVADLDAAWAVLSHLPRLPIDGARRRPDPREESQ